MAPRVALHELLLTFVDNVYFQPPDNVQMKYPCIVYQREDLAVKYANNLPYDAIQRYQVTVIDRDPDSAIPLKVAALPRSSFDRFFVASGLNHDVFRLYF
jgi:hypothetical protein